MKTKIQKTRISNLSIIDNTLILLLILLSSCFDNPVNPIAEVKKEQSIAINVISLDKKNSIDEIIDDMNKAHESIPHGVPSNYDWYSSPVIHNVYPPNGYGFLTNWGQFFETVAGNKTKNTRVQIRNLKTFYLSSLTLRWYELQISEPIDGKSFPENQATTIGSPSDMKYDKEGISATAGNGSCFHYWPRGRAAINPSDIKGIYTSCEARLIVADASLSDDRADARFVLNVGADFWQNNESGLNTLVGMGRLKYVCTGWRTFNFSTLGESTLRQNPPPLNP